MCIKRIKYIPVNFPVYFSPKEVTKNPVFLSYPFWRKQNLSHDFQIYKLNPGEVFKSYKTFNETQKYNQSGVIKERYNYILYQNRNWTQKKKYPIIEIEKEQSPDQILNFKKIFNQKESIYKKQDKFKRKKKIHVDICDYDDNLKNNTFENERIIEEKIVKKVIKKEKEEYYNKNEEEKPNKKYKSNKKLKKLIKFNDY